MEDVLRAAELARAGATRTTRLLSLLGDLDEAEFDAPSGLPGWSRQTIVCHLRYGASAFLRMTRDALGGRETSYYPEGRERQRPATLRPAPHESAVDVLKDWRTLAAALDAEWAVVGERWSTPVIEPSGNADLGTIPLARLALARLTEVDVHGTDLNINAPDWSSVLCEVGLVTRLHWLATRRTNHRTFDVSIAGSWLLSDDDGLRWIVTADGRDVVSRRAADDDEPRGTIHGSRRDLLALLLGRPLRDPLRFTGDVAFAQSFQAAFPGP